MKLFLIIIIVIFFSPFFIGMIWAAVKGNSKRKRAYAIVLLSQMPQGTTALLRAVWNAYKSNNIARVNNIVQPIDPDLKKEVLDRLSIDSRPTQFSSGTRGDKAFYNSQITSLHQQGYSREASELVTGIIIHELDKAL
jgi:hypothetical protein